jgi:hypothetical protein
MPRAGANVVANLPEAMTTIACAKCGRMGRYRRETFLRRFGPDAPLPDVLNLLADCPRRGNASDPCAAVYSEPLGRVG